MSPLSDRTIQLALAAAERGDVNLPGISVPERDGVDGWWEDDDELADLPGGADLPPDAAGGAGPRQS